MAPQAVSNRTQFLFNNNPEAVFNRPHAVSLSPQFVSNEPQAISNRTQLLFNDNPEAVFNRPSAVSLSPQVVSNMPQAISNRPQLLFDTDQAVFNMPQTKPSTKDATPIQAMSHGPTIPGLPSFKDLEEKRKWQLEHMAGAFRVFARHGYTEGMSGHISVRDPIQWDAFWMNPLGVHFGMLKASDMILVNLNGDIIIGPKNRPVNAAGFLIHAAIHRARPDVHAICHTHSTFGRAWSTFARPLEMINQDVCNFYNAQGVYAEYGGLVLGEEEGQRMAKALGPNGKGLTLMNHGLLTVGQTVDEAAYLFRLMEKSCEAQLLVEAAAANGIQKQIIRDEEAAYNFKMASEAENLYCEFQPEYEYELFLTGGAFKD